MKSKNKQVKTIKHYFILDSTTKRSNWNNKRRYS